MRAGLGWFAAGRPTGGAGASICLGLAVGRALAGGRAGIEVAGRAGAAGRAFWGRGLLGKPRCGAPPLPSLDDGRAVGRGAPGSGLPAPDCGSFGRLMWLSLRSGVYYRTRRGRYRSLPSLERVVPSHNTPWWGLGRIGLAPRRWLGAATWRGG